MKLKLWDKRQKTIWVVLIWLLIMPVLLVEVIFLALRKKTGNG